MRKTQTHKIATVLILMLVSLSTTTTSKHSSHASAVPCDCQNGATRLSEKFEKQGPDGLDKRDGVNKMNKAAVDRAQWQEPPNENWKECMWRSEGEVNTGKVMDCMFVKKSSGTVLRVHYGGTIRTSNCKRWYFTFNGAECSSPKSIDGVFNKIKGVNQKILLHHRHIQGYCLNIPKGDVRVGLWVGSCPGKKAGEHISTRYDKDRAANSGWSYVSHIFIEEVEPPKIPS